MIRDKLAPKGIPPFAVGPLHKLAGDGAAAAETTTILLEQDRSYVEWPDAQASGSVLYVSFGSVARRRVHGGRVGPGG